MKYNSIDNSSKQNKTKDIPSLNNKAKEYIPSKCYTTNINMENNKKILIENQTKFIQESYSEYTEDSNSNSFDEYINKEIDRETALHYNIYNKQNINDSYSESDEDKWYPDFKNCECCEGFVYLCKGETCQELNICYCKIKYDLDKD